MALADEADALRRARSPEQADATLRRALDKERAAAAQTLEEPSRSVLLRSAATIALELRELREAERLVATALAGEPAYEVAEELRDILERVYFSRHLDLRGLELAADEFQMSIAGDAVGLGLARSEKFLRRVEDMQRLLYRTAERHAGQKFREQAAPRKEVRDELEVYVSVPRAASLAVSFRLARPRDQQKLFASVNPGKVIADVLRNIQLLNGAEDEQLRRSFDDVAYYRNFVALARQIAPDGQAIKLVGLTAGRRGEEQRVEFTRRSKHIAARPDKQIEGDDIELRGKILFADARARRRAEIRIVGKHGTRAVTVPAGMMADVVRPLWDVDVLARCRHENQRLVLVEVRPDD